jgi:hypothetical protein
LDLTLTFDDKSQTNQADYAKDKIRHLKLAGRYLPIAFAILGVVALVAAMLLLRRPVRSRSGGDDEFARN